jgi:hypothetical protein
MKTWLRRVRGAVGMGLTWAVPAWLIGVGIEVIHNVWPSPLGSLVDIWPAALAYPAFLGGLAFSAVLGIAGRRRSFDELSLPRFAAWGAAGGLLVSLFPVTMGILGVGTWSAPLWQITAVLAGPLMLGGAIAASASLALARRAENRELLAAAEDVADVGLTEVETRDLLAAEADPPS